MKLRGCVGYTNAPRRAARFTAYHRAWSLDRAMIPPGRLSRFSGNRRRPAHPSPHKRFPLSFRFPVDVFPT